MPKNSCSFRFVLGAVLLCITSWSIGASAATEAEKTAAIQNGLANLYSTQQADGHWEYLLWGTNFPQAATGAAVFAFMSQKGYWGTEAATYQTAVDKGIQWLLAQATTTTVGVRTDGFNPCGTGTCTAVYWDGSGEATYTTGLIAPALATYAQGRASEVGTTIGPLAGMTYQQIAQGITNLFAAGQTTAAAGILRGGWRYWPIGQEDSDMSTTQWAIISLIFNETLGATTPQFVKDELKYFLLATQDPTSGGGCYQPYYTDGSWCTHSDTGGLLLGLKFVGYDKTNAQVQKALVFLNSHWTETANNLWYGNFGHPYAMWSVYKGLDVIIGLTDTASITNLLTSCGAPGSPPNGPCNWWEDYNEWLVRNQNPDGSWTGYTETDGGYWFGTLATAFDVNILGATQIPVQNKCPHGQGYWKNTSTWPVASLTLGDKTYDQSALLTILRTSARGDASIILAYQLIAAQLNIAHGSSPAPVSAVISDANTLMTGLGYLPQVVAPSTPTGKAMVHDAATLDSYNNRLLTPECEP